MDFDVNKLLKLAEYWQAYGGASISDVLCDVEEEIYEFRNTAPGSLDSIDELGDIVVNALRVLVRLSPREREFLYRISKMKVDRRIFGPRKKDKEAEAVEFQQIAKELKLK